MIDKNKVTYYRKVNNLTHDELSEKMGMCSMTLYRKLNKNNWLFNEVWQLTQILDCEMNDLLKKEEK